MKAALLPAVLAAALSAGCGAARAGSGPLESTPGERTTLSPAAPAATPEPGPPEVPLTVRWRYAMRHLQIFSWKPTESASPVPDGRRVYAASARGRSLYALDAASGTAEWTYRTGGRVESTPATGGGRVYVADAEGRLHAVSAEAGAPLWRVELRGLPTARVLYDASGGVERVLVSTNDNRVHARNAENGAELWTYRREPPADLTIFGTSSPVRVTLSAGAAYVAGFSDGMLVALRPDNGTVLWESRLVSSGRFRDVDGSVIQHGDRLYVTTYGNELAALDAETGRVLWTSSPGGATGIAVAEGKIIHGADTGEVVARDPADGRELWRWKLPAGVPTTPIAAGDYVFVASSTRSIYALRLTNGTLAWEYDPGWDVSGSWAAPTISGSRVYFTSNVGTVYAFDPAGSDIQYIGSWKSGSER